MMTRRRLVPLLLGVKKRSRKYVDLVTSPQVRWYAAGGVMLSSATRLGRTSHPARPSLEPRVVGLAAHVGPERPHRFLETGVTPVDVVHPADERLALGDQPGDDQGSA